jgi:hypothetical protein
MQFRTIVINDKEVRLEATHYGVDIFVDDGYLTTVWEDGKVKPYSVWLDIGESEAKRILNK